MHWPFWRHRDQPSTDPADWLEVDLVLERGLRDPASAQAAIDRLKQERAAINGIRKRINRQYRDATAGRTKTIARGGGPGAMNDYMLAQNMRQVTDLTAASPRRDAQMEALDERRTAIDRAIRQLQDVARRS